MLQYASCRSGNTIKALKLGKELSASAPIPPQHYLQVPSLNTMFVAVYTVLAAAATVAFARLTPAILSHQNKTVTSQSQCNTGEVHCCNKLTKASDDEASVLLSQLGIVLEDLTADVGIECSPITGIGAGGGSW